MISSYIKIKNKLFNVLIDNYPEKIQASKIINEQWSNIELIMIDEFNINEQYELILTNKIETWIISNFIVKKIEKNKYQIIIGRCKII